MIRILITTTLCLLIITALSPFNQLFAQGKEITGTVTSSENKQPVSGVSVSEKGTRNSSKTDANGYFKINVADNATLVFTSASFEKYETGLNGNSSVTVEMKPDVRSLEDVVVIGYQTIKRKDLLASVSSVSARELKDIPINSAAEALNGRLAGVTATTAGGSQDTDVRIRVRGGMSIATIWHDGSKHEDSKTVLINCSFSRYDGFILGRYHRDAQFFLINCLFAKNMKDTDIYPVPTNNIIQWGRRIYYFNCHREGGQDFSWYKDHLPDHIPEKDITIKWVFGNRWNPELN